MALIDTHCHLDLPDFDDDREEVLDRAQEAGVAAVIIPGTNLESSRRALELAERKDILFAAVGHHPNDSGGWNDNSVKQLRTLARHPKAVAIGEIGLDYYRETTPHEVQKRILHNQLELAAELALPVIVHNRDAGSDLMSILTDWHAQLASGSSPLQEGPGVLHSFSGDPAMAQKALAHHFFIGFTGPVTFSNAPEIRGLSARTPIERMLVETDSPYLSPHPYRGKRNEPARVKLVAEKIAELQGISYESLAEATTANAKRLFNLELLQ